jgi:hypothetical protein
MELEEISEPEWLMEEEAAVLEPVEDLSWVDAVEF